MARNIENGFSSFMKPETTAGKAIQWGLTLATTGAAAAFLWNHDFLPHQFIPSFIPQFQHADFTSTQNALITDGMYTGGLLGVSLAARGINEISTNILFDHTDSKHYNKGIALSNVLTAVEALSSLPFYLQVEAPYIAAAGLRMAAVKAVRRSTS